MDLETFAEDVRRQTVRIMRAIQHGHNEQAGKLAASLCTQAAQMKTRAQFQAQQANPERYDLSAMPAVSKFDE